MAEYDNLLARASEQIEAAYTETIRILSSDEQVRMSIPANPKRDTDLIITDALRTAKEVLAAVRALQTENTELRELIESDREAFAASNTVYVDRILAAERVITEAVKFIGTPYSAGPLDVGRAVDILASYPLGEGQTPKLDPHPFVWDGHSEYDQMRSDTDRFRKGAPHGVLPTMNYRFRPRPEYSQNRDDYEGQTQQGDER